MFFRAYIVLIEQVVPCIVGKRCLESQFKYDLALGASLSYTSALPGEPGEEGLFSFTISAVMFK